MTIRHITFETGPQEFPIGTVAAGYNVTIDGQAGARVVQAGDTTSIDLEPGDYVVRVQLVAPDGSSLGAAMTEAFTVATSATTVTLQVPTAITVA